MPVTHAVADPRSGLPSTSRIYSDDRTCHFLTFNGVQSSLNISTGVRDEDTVAGGSSFNGKPRKFFHKHSFLRGQEI